MNVIHFICALFLQYQQLDLVNRVQFIEVLIFITGLICACTGGLEILLFFAFFQVLFWSGRGLAVAATLVRALATHRRYRRKPHRRSRRSLLSNPTSKPHVSTPRAHAFPKPTQQLTTANGKHKMAARSPMITYYFGRHSPPLPGFCLDRCL